MKCRKKAIPVERIADYVIRKVNKAGARHIFLITGRGILYLTDAVARNKEITPISTFHEQGASFAAMAYASVNDGVSACLVSTGCAAANAVTACLCAYQDNLPVVFISGNNPLNENTRHTGVKIRTYGSQEADIIRIVESVTKYAVMLEDPESAVYEIEKALYIAQHGRKGPVWIDIPLDVQNMRIEEGESEHYVPDKGESPDIREDIAFVKELLDSAERPVILAGGGARSCGKQIAELAEKYHIPVVCSPAASDIYGTANKLSIGTVGSLGGSRAGNMAAQNSDLIIAAGTKLCSQLTGTRENFARGAKVIVVDIDEREHQKDGIRPERLIISDAKEFLDALSACGLRIHDAEWMERCLHWKKVFAVGNEEFVRELKADNKIDLYSLMDELSPILTADATVITDAGFEELIVPSALKYRDGQRCLFPAAQGAMGYAVPAVIGAYEAGRKNLVCIVGDGSIMMNIQELEIISALKIPVKIFVINNKMYAVIRKRQKDLFRQRTIGNDPDDGVPEPDFKNIAQCFGLAYRKIEKREEMLRQLPEIFDGRAELIEIMSAPDQKYFHESYALNDKRKLVHRPIEDMSPFLPRDVIEKEMIVPMMEE